MSVFRVGIATVDYTPRPGLPLMGNFRDDYAARGVHDPLRAKALVFEDPRGGKAALLTVDICMLDRGNVAAMRQAIAATSGVAPENVLIHATHTHSAPAPHARFLFGLDFEPFRAATAEFLAVAASAVAAAERDLREARLAVGYSSEERLVFNRRLRRKDGATQMNWEALAPGFAAGEVEAAWGPVDPRVACLVVERQGRPVAAITNYGLHPAILAGDNWLYSADYPGCLAEALSRTQGDDFTSLFFNGCCGNVNHIDYRDPLQGRGYGMTQRVGYVLAAAVGQAINARRPAAAERVALSRELVALPRVEISEADYRHCQQVMEEARRQPLRGQVDGLPEAHFAGLRLAMYENQRQPDHAEVLVLRVGDVALVGLPGEVFCEIGIELRRASPAPHTLVAGLSDDAIGYLPTRESFAQGGYEVTTGSTFYQPGAAERLAHSAIDQLGRLFAE
jgi:hypothetical protein